MNLDVRDVWIMSVENMFVSYREYAQIQTLQIRIWCIESTDKWILQESCKTSQRPDMILLVNPL